MNGKIKRIFSMILVACMLLSLVPLHAASLNGEEDSLSNEFIVDDELSAKSDTDIEGNNMESVLSSEMELSSSTISDEVIEKIKTSDKIASSLSLDNNEEIAEQQNILTMADEEIEEPENDNWELGLVFYDSSVDNGKTPLTEINWDASDGGYNTGESRVITVQINYKNTNAVKTYQQGELAISIPNLVYNTTSELSAQWSSSVIVGANDSTHSGYDWDFVTALSPNNTQKDYVFTNSNIIEEKSNFEGSIQIIYTITPRSEEKRQQYYFENRIEKYQDECIHLYNKNLIATLNNVIKSNEIILNYIRKYTHPWEKVKYSIKKSASRLSSYDGLGVDALNYTWVKYSFMISRNTSSDDYPNIHAKLRLEDVFPSECVISDGNYSILENTFTLDNISSFENNIGTIFVGYPKSIYNEENGNLNITNTVNLFGIYDNESDEVFLDDDTININLADYEFQYSGNLYGIKKATSYTNSMIQQRIKKDGDDSTWYLRPTAIYTGTPMTVKIGDDLLFATSNNGNIEQLKDDDFYFSNISFYSVNFRNGNDKSILSEQYDCELWVRYKNINDYVLYNSFKNSNKSWEFNKDDGIVGFYFMIYDVKESLKSYTGSYAYPTGPISAGIIFNKNDIPESGRLYNFDYIQVYFKDVNNNLILQNEPGIESYVNFITKDDIASFDKETYGTYMQRDSANFYWNYFKVNQITHSIGAKKSFNKIIQNSSEELFSSSCNIGCRFFSDNGNFNSEYAEQYDNQYAIKGFEIYDLIPTGMEITSNKDEIIKSLEVIPDQYAIFYDTNFNVIDKNNVGEYVNVKSSIELTSNWNNTGRDRIKIIGILENPILVGCNIGNSYRSLDFQYTYNFDISYDSFLEYGNVWFNNCYVNSIQDNIPAGCEYQWPIKDNGYYDKDAIDIDEDGQDTDDIAYYKAQTTITSVVSTHQDVTKYVQTDMSNYSTGTVESSYDSEYEYKLRVRTGQNDITNLVIYDSIEEYTQDKDGNIVPAYGTKNHWNGEFLRIDTSYAESKGYVVKPYYSENVLAGNLYNDDGTLNPDWKEYVNDDENIYEYGEPETITSPNWPNSYNNNMTEAQNYWEVQYPNSELLEIKFDSTCKLESATYDYLRFYDKNGNNITSSVCGISADKIGGSDLADKTYTIPDDYVKITMRTDGSGVYKGFSANVTGKMFKETHYGTDKSKVKALAFEYLDADGNPAKLPENSLTYVLIKMKSPSDENITSLAYNGCRTQWQALDDYDRPVDFITGINSNIVKVSLPNSVEDKIVNLSFHKIIDATDEDFDKLKLDKDATYNFFISLTNQETGEVINGLLDSKEGFRVTNIPIGTYIIKEEDDIWFNFVSMGLSELIEGIDFQGVDGEYILTINATVESDAAIEIDITNKPDEERFYDSKYDIKNLFNLTK